MGGLPLPLENTMAVLPPLIRERREIEHRIHAALEDERAKQETPRTHIRLSSIGKCPRELWALRQGQPEERSNFAPPMGRNLMTFSIGHHLEGAVVEWLRKAGLEVEGTAPDGEQWEVFMRDGLGAGHMDGNIQWGSPSAQDWRLLEIKTAKAKKFEELLECESYAKWNPGYLDQIQAYMGASHETESARAVSEALVVVVCKDDSRLYSEMIRFDSDQYETLVERARLAMADEMPARPPAMKSQYCKACKYCGVNKWCWSPMAGVQFDE